MTSKVALVRCTSYDEQAVYEAVMRGMDLLGGMASIIQPGEKIVLKPNVLVGDDPEKCVGPHPLVFKAAARLVQAVTANVEYGDSPGAGKPSGQLRRAGYGEIAEEMGIPLADFETGREVSFPDSPFIKRLTLASGALDADGLVSLCKLKTHQITRLTGAVKNQFGCVPGRLKAEYHIKLPNPTDFAKMLVTINLYLRPRLYIMDGITAMEGNGPRSGSQAQMNVLLLSTDPVALDATACRMIGLDPLFVPTNFPGLDWGLGTFLAEEIELLGDPLESFVNLSFDVVRKPVQAMGGSSSALPFVRNLVSPRPVIDPAKCGYCGTCVTHCPVRPKAVDWKDGDRKQAPVYHYERCIRCYCCQELCPESAITVTTPFLGRFFQP
jgi:uncharacterized protein (DUF362 family)/Pyruvate/2-oxoacid:ferredoxin oxidoreductase delta subunit